MFRAWGSIKSQTMHTGTARALWKQNSVLRSTCFILGAWGHPRPQTMHIGTAVPYGRTKQRVNSVSHSTWFIFRVWGTLNPKTCTQALPCLVEAEQRVALHVVYV